MAKMGNGVLFCCVALMTVCLLFAEPLTCPPGTYLYIIKSTDEKFCIECQDGTFMQHSFHQRRKCKTCEKILDSDLEILVLPCNKTHDAVIHCVDGYYRDRDRNSRDKGMCKKCTECPYVGRPCSTYRDTVCCPDEHSEVVRNKDGAFVCREKVWFCRRGYYFDIRGFQCVPCPRNTFMPLDYNIQPECWDCREYNKYESYRPLHSVVIQPCNSTHAPVIRCEDGFFMDHNLGYGDDNIGCSPCTDCSTKTDVQYEGRKCDGMEDTVCCPQPNMTVVVNSSGDPACVTLSASCDGQQCDQHDVKEQASTGAPLDESENMDKRLDHSTPSDWLQKTVSEDDERSSDIHGTSFALGMTAGMAVIITGLLIYILYIKGHCHRWWRFARKRLSLLRSYIVQQETEGVDENVPLQPSNTNMATDHYGHDQCCGDESDLYSKKKSCKNSTGHAQLTSFKTLTVESLPEGFRNNGKMAYIKAVGNLTVRLKVNHTSNDRPDNYPCSELRGSLGAGIKRFGTGLVFQVTKKFGEDTNGTCPCRYCSVYHNHAKKTWAEFAVATSAQLVYDNDECKRTSCRLWFNGGKDFVRAPSLKGKTVKEFSTSQNFRILYCVTHDKEVSQKLETMINELGKFHPRYQQAPKPKTTESKLAVLIYHYHGLSKKILNSIATEKMDRGVQKWSYDIHTSCPGSIGAPVCLLGNGQGSDFSTTIHSMGNESTGFHL